MSIYRYIHDLRDDYKAVKIVVHNELIIILLKKLVVCLKDHKADIIISKEKMIYTQKINSIEKAITSICNYTHEITSGKEALKLPGIGKGIAARIDEIIKTKHLKEIDEIMMISPNAIIINELCTVTGIGPVKAQQLIDLGITSITDLIMRWKSGELTVKKNMLTHHITVGLEYYYDIMERAPWSDIDDINTFLCSTCKLYNPKLNITTCGSYRRRLITCGDIDVLLTHDDIITDDDLISAPDYLNLFIEYLKECNFIVGSLTSDGKTKFMGVAKFDGKPGRRIDIRFITVSSKPCAMLYFTGSGDFNKIMRHKANSLGYTINEYGIYTYIDGVKGDIIPVGEEADIFKIINCLYILPHER